MVWVASVAFLGGLLLVGRWLRFVLLAFACGFDVYLVYLVILVWLSFGLWDWCAIGSLGGFLIGWMVVTVRWALLIGCCGVGIVFNCLVSGCCGFDEFGVAWWVVMTVQVWVAGVCEFGGCEFVGIQVSDELCLLGLI